MRVGIANEIEPVARQSFAVVRTGEEPIDETVVPSFGILGEIGIDLGRRRRQAGEVEGDAGRANRGVGIELLREATAIEAEGVTSLQKLAKPRRS